MTDCLDFSPTAIRHLRATRPDDIGDVLDTILGGPPTVVIDGQRDDDDERQYPWVSPSGTRYTDDDVHTWTDTLRSAYREHTLRTLDLTDAAAMHANLDAVREAAPHRVGVLLVGDIGEPVVRPDRTGSQRRPWYWITTHGVSYADEHVSTLDPVVWPAEMIVNYRAAVELLPIGTLLDWFGSGPKDYAVVTGHELLPVRVRDINVGNPDGDRFMLHLSRADGFTRFDGTRLTFAEVTTYVLPRVVRS